MHHMSPKGTNTLKQWLAEKMQKHRDGEDSKLNESIRENWSKIEHRHYGEIDSVVERDWYKFHGFIHTD